MTPSMMPYRDRVYPRYTSEKVPSTLKRSEAEYVRWGDATLSRVGPWLPKRLDASVVELACGPGNMLHLLRRLGYTNVVGVDISPEQVQFARQVGFTVIESDLFDFLSQRNSDVDCIVAFDIIEHLDKDEVFRFLDGCHRALSPGGSLILQTPNAESPWGAHLRYADITHELAFAPSALEHVLRVTGFDRYDVRESGPHIHGLQSVIRWAVWRAIRLALMIWNIAETGTIGSGVYTRVFLARAIRQA